MNAVDTNVLIYAHDPRDPSKQAAMILAACITAGVTRLYTEDFSGYAEVEGVQIVDPFRPA